MFSQFNVVIFEAINSLAGKNPFLDVFAIILSVYLPFFLIGWLAYLWFIKDKRDITLYAVYSAILGLCMNYLIRIFYFHPRPFMMNLGNLLIKHARDSSFPSDHTTFMLSLAFMLLYFRETRASGVLLSLFGFICGVARIFSGLHFPGDIIGSLVVSVIASYLIFLFRSRLERLNQYITWLYFQAIRLLRLQVQNYDDGKD